MVEWLEHMCGLILFIWCGGVTQDDQSQHRGSTSAVPVGGGQIPPVTLCRETQGFQSQTNDGVCVRVSMIVCVFSFVCACMFARMHMFMCLCMNGVVCVFFAHAHI